MAQVLRVSLDDVAVCPGHSHVILEDCVSYYYYYTWDALLG